MIIRYLVGIAIAAILLGLGRLASEHFHYDGCLFLAGWLAGTVMLGLTLR